MANELMNVEAFKNVRPAAAFVQQPVNESLADGIGASYGVLSYKGKAWALNYRGERHMLLRPDDGTPMGYIDVIIVKQARNKSKSYYAPGTYDPNNPSNERPLCSSLDGIKPDADARQPQAQACAICPHNEFKQLPDGKKRRDCSDYKRLGVLLMPAISKLMLNGEALSEPIFLRIPPASLNDLASYGQFLEAQGFPYFSVVTRIKFDANEAHPKMIFSAQRPLSDDDAKFILPLRDDPQTLRIIGEGGPLARPTVLAAAPQTQQLAAPQTNVVQMQPQVQPQQQVQQPQQEVLPPVKQQQVQQPQPPKEFELEDSGSLSGALAGTGTMAPTKPQPQVGMVQGARQTAEDTGFPVAADAALEDKIASLLKTS